VGKLKPAMVVVASEIGTILLLTPDAASARPARGVSTGIGTFQGAPIVGYRDHGFVGRGDAHGWRGGAVRRDGAALGWRQQRGVGFGAVGWGDAGDPPPAYGPDCQVYRVQLSDEYGWRVRNVVVCP
jgi:hypothetical protein